MIEPNSVGWVGRPSTGYPECFLLSSVRASGILDWDPGACCQVQVNSSTDPSLWVPPQPRVQHSANQTTLDLVRPPPQYGSNTSSSFCQLAQGPVPVTLNPALFSPVFAGPEVWLLTLSLGWGALRLYLPSWMNSLYLLHSPVPLSCVCAPSAW